MTDLETQLRDTLLRHADDAVVPGDLAGGARDRSRQVGRRRIVGFSALAVAIVATGTVAGLAALTGRGGDSAQRLVVAADPTTSTGSGGFGFDPSGPSPRCPKGELPDVAADLSRTVSSGTSPADGQAWTDPFVRSRGSVSAVSARTVAKVNGTARTSDPAVWVLVAVKGRFTESVLLVRTSHSTWVAHPAGFAGCARK
jgi:hypothetical protein